MRNMIESNALVGRVIESIDQIDREAVRFNLEGGKAITFYHDQDCCESVRLHEVRGDLEELRGKVLSVDEEVHRNVTPALIDYRIEYPDSYTWTIQKIAAEGGGATLIWLGESNGYYSESIYASEE